MLFTDSIFLFYFLPFALVIHRLTLGRGEENKYPIISKIVLFLLTLVFYGYRDLWWLVPFLVSVGLDYIWAKLLLRTKRPMGRKLLLTASILQNIFLLLLFKYRDFLHVYFSWIPQIRQDGGSLALPAGISFYTFESLSFVIDIYRGKVEEPLKASDFFAFIGMFPRFVAGPITRFPEMVKQFRDYRGVNVEKGLTLFIGGLFRKVVFADQFGLLAAYAYGPPFDGSMLYAWLGMISYAMQLYFDFSGYSQMAIGLGHCLGFRFPENFDRPYLSSSLREIWQRWHITLSMWLRDYVYISLGGNQRGPWRTYLNIFITMVIGGIWHGANWMFLIFGIWHGVFLCIERRFTKFQARPSVLGHIWVITVFWVSLVIFKSTSFSQAIDIFRALAGFGTPHPSIWTDAEPLSRHFITLIAAFCGLVYCFFLEGKIKISEKMLPQFQKVGVFGLLLVSLILLFSMPESYFLYFQF